MRVAGLFALLWLAVAGVYEAQDVVDRMVAIVNKRVILESELEQTARVEEMLQGTPAHSGQPSAQEEQAVLNRLIDRSLLEQQIDPTAPLDPSPSELAERIQEIRSKIPSAATDEGWKTVLAAYGLMPRDVEVHVISEFRILHFVDLHFRGLVRVDRSDIQNYYQETFLPEMQKRGAAAPPLAEVSDKIEKILAEQRMDEMLNEWLQTLRTQAHIEKLMAPGTSLAHGDHP